MHVEFNKNDEPLIFEIGANGFSLILWRELETCRETGKSLEFWQGYCRAILSLVAIVSEEAMNLANAVCMAVWSDREYTEEMFRRIIEDILHPFIGDDSCE